MEIWPIWRLVLAQIATLQEIDCHWSLVDVLHANHLLDIQQAAEYEARMQAQAESRPAQRR